jgi:hypothetical protein
MTMPTNEPPAPRAGTGEGDARPIINRQPWTGLVEFEAPPGSYVLHLYSDGTYSVDATGEPPTID